MGMMMGMTMTGGGAISDINDDGVSDIIATLSSSDLTLTLIYLIDGNGQFANP
jgi:hypothetical protein